MRRRRQRRKRSSSSCARGADFAALAKANSQDPSSSGNGGDMGWVDRGATVEPFDTAVFTVPLNTISDPIRSKEFGYHIIKVLERASGRRTAVRGSAQPDRRADRRSRWRRIRRSDEINRIAAQHQGEEAGRRRPSSRRSRTKGQLERHAVVRQGRADSRPRRESDAAGVGILARSRATSATSSARSAVPRSRTWTASAPAGVAPLEECASASTNDAKHAEGARSSRGRSSPRRCRRGERRRRRQRRSASPPQETTRQPPGLHRRHHAATPRRSSMRRCRHRRRDEGTDHRRRRRGRLPGARAEEGRPARSWREPRRRSSDNMRQREARNLRTSLLQRLRKDVDRSTSTTRLVKPPAQQQATSSRERPRSRRSGTSPRSACS